MKKRLFALLILALPLVTLSAIARPTAPRDPEHRKSVRELVIRIINSLGPNLGVTSTGDSMTGPKPTP